MPASSNANATAKKLGTPDFNVSYVSTKHKKLFGFV